MARDFLGDFSFEKWWILRLESLSVFPIFDFGRLTTKGFDDRFEIIKKQ